MKLHELKPARGGATKNIKRLGRGTSSGYGRYSTRGRNGQNARSGGGVRMGFEGGQLPLFRSVPKHGFTNNFSKQFAQVNVSDLNRFEDGSEIDAQTLIDSGLIHKGDLVDGLKILGDGELERKLTVKAQKFTKTAEEKIVQAGGKAEVI